MSDSLAVCSCGHPSYNHTEAGVCRRRVCGCQQFAVGPYAPIPRAPENDVALCDKCGEPATAFIGSDSARIRTFRCAGVCSTTLLGDLSAHGHRDTRVEPLSRRPLEKAS